MCKFEQMYDMDLKRVNENKNPEWQNVNTTIWINRKKARYISLLTVVAKIEIVNLLGGKIEILN